MLASNGVIHLLEGVLLPPTILPILPKRCSEEQHQIVAVSVSPGRGRPSHWHHSLSLCSLSGPPPSPACNFPGGQGTLSHGSSSQLKATSRGPAD